MRRVMLPGLVSLLWLAMPVWCVGQEVEAASSGSNVHGGGTVAWEYGWGEWQLDGAENKLRQYATPPDGLFLGLLEYRSTLSGRGNAGGLRFSGLGQEDYAFGSNLLFWFGRTRLEGRINRNRFFDDTPVLIQASEREIEEGSIQHKLWPGFGISMQYRMDEQEKYYEPPTTNLRQKTRYWDAVVGGAVGPGTVGLSYANWRYYDRTLALPEMELRRLSARYVWEPTQRFGLEPSYRRISIDQPGMAQSKVTSSAVSGSYSLGPATDFAFSLTRDDFEMPNALSALIRERRVATAGIKQRWEDWTAQGFVKRVASERLRDDHSYVDVPIWTTWEGKISGALAQDWRLTLKASRQHLSDTPIVQTNDTRQLHWDDKGLVQAKLEGAAGSWSGYFSFNHRFYENDVRQVELKARSYVAGGAAQFGPALDIYWEWAKENWSGSYPADNPDLRSYLPGTRSTVVGCNWTLGRRDFLSISYTDFITDNDNPLLLRGGNVDGQYFTISLRHQMASGNEWRLTVSPRRYRDKNDWAMNYDATLVSLTGSAKF